MICYKDRTYCSFYKVCNDGDACLRALTPEVDKAAKEFGLPISYFVEKPTCYKELCLHNIYRIWNKVTKKYVSRNSSKTMWLNAHWAHQQLTSLKQDISDLEVHELSCKFNKVVLKKES